MKYGNLTNELAPIVGIRFETVVYNFGKVNPPGKSYCESILSKDINLYFFSLLPERKVKAWCYKWGVIYTAVLGADSVLEIPELARAHKIALYVDTDERLLQAISERGDPKIEILKWEQDYRPSESTFNKVS